MMNKEQAVNVMESIINGSLKAGLFQNIADFQCAVTALDIIKSETGYVATVPEYVQTSTADIKEQE